MSFNNRNQNPAWVGSIQRGDFDRAEQELARSAAVHLGVQHVEREVQRLVDQAGPYGKYVHPIAAQRAVEENARLGNEDPNRFVDIYDRCLNEEIANFRSEIRPGYQRTSTEPYTPADQEVRDYVQERQAQQQALKDEGRRIATLPAARG